MFNYWYFIFIYCNIFLIIFFTFQSWYMSCVLIIICHNNDSFLSESLFKHHFSKPFKNDSDVNHELLNPSTMSFVDGPLMETYFCIKILSTLTWIKNAKHAMKPMFLNFKMMMLKITNFDERCEVSPIHKRKSVI